MPSQLAQKTFNRAVKETVRCYSRNVFFINNSIESSFINTAIWYS